MKGWGILLIAFLAGVFLGTPIRKAVQARRAGG